MNSPTDLKPKKKIDLGTIAFAKVQKLEKRVTELESALKSLTQTIRDNGGSI